MPTLLFLVLVITLAVSLSLSARPPEIDRLLPEIGLPGGVLVIEGKNFGESSDDGTLSLAGVRPTSASFVEWTNTRISVQIPEEVGSGPVRVTTRVGSSNAALFTNRNLIPVVVTETSVPGYPHIDSVEPAKGAVGSIVSLSGFDFGLSRGDGVVLFTALPLGGNGEGNELSVPASDLDFDYERWAEQSIRVRVPDGASSGTIRVVTDRGTSNALFFEVVRVGGSKSLRHKRGYQIASTVTVDHVAAAPEGTLDFWIPGPPATPVQRNVEAIRTPEPVRDTHSGVSLFRLMNLDPDATYRIDLTYWLDRYALETRISPARIRASYDTERKLFKVFTAPDALVLSDDETLVQAAASVGRSEKNPYLLARALYRFLLTRMSYDRKSTAKSLRDAFISSSGDAEEYSLLLCAFLRARGIPARPVAGVLVYDKRRTIRHVWAEFYVEQYGWIPMDPVLGDGVHFGDFPDLESPEEYYFGNIDEQHISFTRGIVDIAAPNGDQSEQVSFHRFETVPSLQTAYEQASPEVSSYHALWSRIEIIDFW